MPPIPSFCVVLPVYNERAGIEARVRTIAEFLKGASTRTAIIVVDDGSRDGSLDILRRLAASLPNVAVEAHAKNGGYGAANRTGFAAALREDFDYVLVMDADGTQDPAYIESFFAPMAAGVDFIKATRYALGGRAIGVGRRRYLISWVGNRLAKAVMRINLTDYTNGFRAIRAPLLRKMHTRETGFAMLMEEVRVAHRLGATFSEVPYTLTVRSGEESASKFSYSLRVYLTYLKYVFFR
jgi:glycosyltransferase involved in cell wall biosynthesis